MPYRRICNKVSSKFYAFWLMLINFAITTACLGTIVWCGARIIMHPLTYTECMELGAILAGFDFVYNLIKFKQLS